MSHLPTLFVSRTRRRSRERGASLVEYALLVSLIAVVCIVAVVVLGETTSESFNDSGSSLFSD